MSIFAQGTSTRLDYIKDMEEVTPPQPTTPKPTMANSYTSNLDFATQLCRLTKPSKLDQYLPRTLRNNSNASFERHLHDAMGWGSHTVDTDGF